MNTSRPSAMERLIRAEVGDAASISLVSGTNLTPMSVVLDCAKRQLGKSVEVWWVDNGPPTMFALSSTQARSVIFSTRALEIAAQTRQLYEEALGSLAKQASYRLTLLHLSELLLQQRSASLATAAFLESIRGQSLFLPFGTDWRFLEHEPINEAYMALWFFSLGHELGHISVEGSEVLNSGMREVLNDQVRSLAIQQIEQGLNMPEIVKAKLRTSLHNPDTDLPIYASSLMEECAADVFSCQILLESTFRVFQRMEKNVSLWKIAYELLAANSVRSHFDTLKGMAKIFLTTEHWEDSAHRYFAYSLAASTRTHYLADYLTIALSKMLEGDLVPTLVEDLKKSVHESASLVSAGAVDAFSYLATVELKESHHRLPVWFHEEISRSPFGISDAATRFCQIAKSYSVESTLLHEMGQLVGNNRADA